MGRRREQRREERATFGRGGTATRYRMRQKLVAFGDDFWIENEAGQRTFKVDGKMLRVRDTLFFEDMQGQTLCKIQEKLLRVRDTKTIEGPNDEPLATVRKALITPLRDRWTVKIGDGPDLDVQGNILDHQYTCLLYTSAGCSCLAATGGSIAGARSGCGRQGQWRRRHLAR